LRQRSALVEGISLLFLTHKAGVQMEFLISGQPKFGTSNRALSAPRRGGQRVEGAAFSILRPPIPGL